MHVVHGSSTVTELKNNKQYNEGILLKRVGTGMGQTQHKSMITVMGSEKGHTP